LQQAVVVKGLRRAQHDVAVHVVLEVLLRLVAHAHRAHAAVAGQVSRIDSGSFALQADAVQRLDVPPCERITTLHRASAGSPPWCPLRRCELSARTTKKASRSQQ
jgi:hypothetical protein